MNETLFMHVIMTESMSQTIPILKTTDNSTFNIIQGTVQEQVLFTSC